MRSGSSIIRPLQGWAFVMAAEIFEFHSLGPVPSYVRPLHIYRARLIISSFFIISGFKNGLSWASSSSSSSSLESCQFEGSSARQWLDKSKAFVTKRILPVSLFILLMDPLSRWIALRSGSVTEPMHSLWTVNPITYCWGSIWGQKPFLRYYPNEALWYLSDQIMFYLLTPLLMLPFQFVLTKARTAAVVAVWVFIMLADYAVWGISSRVHRTAIDSVDEAMKTHFIISPWNSNIAHYLLGLATATLALKRPPFPFADQQLVNFVWRFRCDLLLTISGCYLVFGHRQLYPPDFANVDGQFRLCGVVALLLLFCHYQQDDSVSSKVLGCRWLHRVAPANTNLITYICQVPLMCLLTGLGPIFKHHKESNVLYLICLWISVLLIDRYLFAPLATRLLELVNSSSERGRLWWLK